MSITIKGTITKDRGLLPAAGTVGLTPDGGSLVTETLDATGSFTVSESWGGQRVTAVYTITGDSFTTRTKVFQAVDGQTVDLSIDIGRVGTLAMEAAEAGVHVPVTSVQNATTAAVDLTTSEALANALKGNYNALQTDVAALVASLQGAGLLASS